MTRKCVIEGCSSKSGSPQHRGVTFHSFPFDSKTREIWLVNCKISADKNITKSVLVCSRHFRRADFQPLKANKYLLKQGSVPTIFPWGKLAYVEPKSDTTLLNEANLKSEISIGESVVGDSSVKYESSGEGSKSDSSFPSAVKRSAEDSSPNQHQVKLPKISFETSGQIEEKGCVSSPPSIGIISVLRKTDTVSGFTPGVRLEAQDFDGVWHAARVVEVDNDEREVLIRFEKSGKGKGTGVEEWIPMNSSRLRQKTVVATKSSVFVSGEKCLARWSGSRRFPATIKKVLNNDSYEVLFDDGYTKVVKGVHISKLKGSVDKVTVKEQKEQTAKSTPTESKPKITPKKDWPLISVSSLNLDELNLPEIPQDGEWCCHWVNDQPIGKEGFLTVGDHRKATVIVDDWRLPADWTKHMYQRSNVLGKWDVILINPAGKRFRSKADLKQYIEDMGQQYNPDIYDFSIHRRRAKDIGAYVYTKDYKTPAVPTTERPVATTTPPSTALVSQTSPVSQTPSQLEPVEPAAISEGTKEKITPLEDGYVYVGSLKVQIVDNLFRCPESSCNKNFRKENHLQIHIKHYHDGIAKLLGECPNMQDLACKRTIGHPSEEPLPKNHLPNSQFFAKLHQQDLQTKTHRKSIPAPAPVSVPVASTSTAALPSSPIASTSDLPIVSASSESVKTETIEAVASSQEPTANVTSTVDTPSTIKGLASPTANSVSLSSEEPKSTHKSRKGASETSHRKSSRQRLTKKYLSATTSGIFDGSFAINDLEETRHSFNGTPENKSKKSKLIQFPLVGDSNLDANSHTTGSIPENSQSPKYISENGEIIKIVRMRQEEIINCMCSYGEEDGLMIQCELCLCWQHGICNGIEKESQVPEKYVCCICRNPQRGRSSLKYIHDQDWLYDGKLPMANYHAQNPEVEERFETLRKTHTLTGNLLELKRFLHSLKVKMNIAENKDHPKMYLWAKKWELSPVKENFWSNKMRKENTVYEDIKIKHEDDKIDKSEDDHQVENEKESNEIKGLIYNQPTIPQPEAPIDPVECQHQLLEHIQQQQKSVMDRLETIESQIMDIESLDDCNDLNEDCLKTSQTLSMLIRDLEVMKNIAKINTVHTIYGAYT